MSTDCYLSDAERLSVQMGQFVSWCGHLFYWSGDFLGWRYLK